MAAASAGVSYSDFLSMTPAQLQAVRDGYLRRIDCEAWLLGLYTQSALTAVLSAAFAKKGQTTVKYPARPYGKFGVSHSADENTRQEESDRLRAKLYMQNMVRAGKNWGK